MKKANCDKSIAAKKIIFTFLALVVCVSLFSWDFSVSASDASASQGVCVAKNEPFMEGCGDGEAIGNVLSFQYVMIASVVMLGGALGMVILNKRANCGKSGEDGNDIW